jgi:hypothetical protein
MDYLKTLDTDSFNAGMDVEPYVAQVRNYRSLVKQLMKEAEADANHVDTLKAEAARYPQPVRATANTEDWCGDWAVNVPVLHSLFSRAGIPFKVFRGSEHPLLKERYERDGDDHIPAVSIWDGEGNELVRWIEAPAKVQELKANWKADHPEFEDLYARMESDKDAEKRFAKLYREFLETMAGWYRDGMWNETTREIVEQLVNTHESG